MDILPQPSHARDHVAAAYGAGAAAAVCNAADASHAGTAARQALGSTRRAPARAAPPHERAAPPHLCPPSRQPHLRPGLRPHLCSSARPRPHLQLTRPRAPHCVAITLKAARAALAPRLPTRPTTRLILSRLTRSRATQGATKELSHEPKGTTRRRQVTEATTHQSTWRLPSPLLGVTPELALEGTQ